MAYPSQGRKHRVIRQPLHFPGGGETILEAVDADLLARVIDWASRSPTARNQAFNVTNGDSFRWSRVWPLLAQWFGIPCGVARPVKLAKWMADKLAGSA